MSDTPWDEMTEDQREARNEASYAACADLLRREADANPGADLNECKARVEAQMLADMRECDRIMKRGARSRASKLDKRSAESARIESNRLGFDAGMLWDVEV